VYGNFQMLPRPTAAPMDASMKARRPDQFSDVVEFTGIALLCVSYCETIVGSSG